MSATISRPSSWMATGNPITYTFVRKDYTVTQVNNNAGFAQYQVNGIDITAFAIVGKRVYGGCTSNFGIGTITAKSFAAGNTLITTNQVYLGSGGGYINLIEYFLNYYLKVEVWDNLKGTLIGTKKSYPLTDGTMYVDVKEQVRSMITTNRDIWNADSVGTFAYVKKDLVVSNNAWAEYYVKYTEVWTGSANAQTNDSANVKYALLAAMYSYNGNNWTNANNTLSIYSATSNKKFLTRFENPVVFKDGGDLRGDQLGGIAGTSLQYIEDKTYTTTTPRIKQEYYGMSGDYLFTLYHLPDSLTKGLYTAYENGSTIQRRIFGNHFNGAGTAWTGGGTHLTGQSVTLGVGATSKDYLIPIDTPSTGTTEFTFYFTNVSGANATYTLTAYQSNGVTIVSTQNYSDSSVSVIRTFSVTNSTSIKWIAIRISVAGAGSVFNLTNIVALKATMNAGIPDMNTVLEISKSNISMVEIDNALPRVDTVISETLPLYFKYAGDNAVNICWRNNLGAVSNWSFAYSQDYLYRFDGNVKIKRAVLYTENLTPDQWEAINELNKTGTLYKNGSTRFIKGNQRDNSFVWLNMFYQNYQNAINSNGLIVSVTRGIIPPVPYYANVFIELIVIPSENKTKSRTLSKSIQIIIEFPEINQAQ